MKRKTLIVLFVTAIAFGLFGCSSSKTIDLNNYITFSEEGATPDHGTITYSVDWEKLNQDIDASAIDKCVKELNPNLYDLIKTNGVGFHAEDVIAFEAQQAEGLSNGDTVTINVIPSAELYPATIEDVEKQLKIKFVPATHTMSELIEVKLIDFFSEWTDDYLVFSGKEGEASVSYRYKDYVETTIYDDGVVKVIFSGGPASRSAEVYKDGQIYLAFNYTGIVSWNIYNLKNGDVFPVGMPGSVKEKLALIGYAPKEEIKENVVTGLE